MGTRSVTKAANLGKTAPAARRPLTHDAETWSCELDWMVDGVGEWYHHGSCRA